MDIKTKIEQYLSKLESKAAEEQSAEPSLDRFGYYYRLFTQLEENIIKPVFHEAEELLCSKCFEARVEHLSNLMLPRSSKIFRLVRLVFTQLDLRGDPINEDRNSVEVEHDMRRERLVIKIESAVIGGIMRGLEESMELSDLSRKLLEGYVMKAIKATVRKAPFGGTFERPIVEDDRSGLQRRNIPTKRMCWPAIQRRVPKS